MRGSCVALALVFLGCGGGGGGPGPEEGELEILDEGTGDANVEPLFPLRSGTLSSYRRGTVRAPVELPDGRIAHRYLNEARQLSMTGPLDAASENWLAEGDEGVWFLGSTNGGMLDTPILLVPATVRVGMRWRTGSASTSREYEVLRRDELINELGSTVLWTIEQKTESPIYRLYAEGWGLLDVSESGPPNPMTWEPFEPIRAVSREPRTAQSTGPTLTLRELTLEGSLPERWDSVRAIRLLDGRTTINVMAASSGITGTNRLAYDLLFEGEIVSVDEFGEHFPPDVVNHERISSWWPDRDYEVTGAGSGINAFGYGNVLYVGERIAWSVDDQLYFINELGGVSASATDGFPTDGNFRFELMSIEPGYGEAFTMRPNWGGMLNAYGRILLADDPTPARVPFAQVAGSLTELWLASSEAYADGRRISEPLFVEAFPGAFDRGFAGGRGPLISTTTAPSEQIHLMTSPGGIIDRIVVDMSGARRERLGRATLPEGQELRAAADVGDGALVLFTYERANEAPHVWLAEGTARAPAEPEGFVTMMWSRWDARVCWPATSEALDTSDWRLGLAAPAGVVLEGDNCAMVLRDIEAAPIPSEASLGDPPAGSLVFEGSVPGVGRVRAFQPRDSDLSVPSRGAWLRGGGAIDMGRVGSTAEALGLRYSRGGMPLGRQPYIEFSGGVPDLSGAGVWAYTTLRSWPDGHCGRGCAPDGAPALALTGPDPQVFELETRVEAPLLMVRSGGALLRNTAGQLVESDHTGWVHLRTDGSLVEITMPEVFSGEELRTVRESGEICGTGMRDGLGVVWCAQPDGTSVREGRVDTVGEMHLLDDDTALLGTGAPLLLDLTTLTTRAYPALGSVQNGSLTIGADGVTYGVVNAPDGTPTLGALRESGFVPLSEIYDVSALVLDGREPDSFFVTEDITYIAIGYDVVRVPRARWDGVVDCTPSTEICDGMDNDCDGDIDEALSSQCWLDADEDGYAAADAIPTTLCGCPAGMTDREPTGDDIDCADNDARAFPGQTMFFAMQIPDSVAGESFDFDCNGVEEGRWGSASCTDAGSMMCESTEGFIGVGVCGAATPFQGCPDPDEPGTCGGSCTFDVGLFFCTMGSSSLFWTQECR